MGQRGEHHGELFIWHDNGKPKIKAFFKFDNLISSEQWNENGETEPVDEEWKESVENINKISENPIDAESIHKLLLERLLENSSELLPESN